MTPKNEDYLSLIQSKLLWVALACLAAKFMIDSDTAKEMFGTIWILVKQTNAVIMWLSAILSGKEFLDLLERIKTATKKEKIDAK